MALSFAVNRPSNAGRHRAFGDSDEEDNGARDESLTSFDAVSAQRKREDAKRSAFDKLTIASLPNKDWKAEAARLRGASKRKTYLPEEATGQKATITALNPSEADKFTTSTQGGLAQTTRPARDTTPVIKPEITQGRVSETVPQKVEDESEDAQALRELLRSARKRSNSPDDNDNNIELDGVDYTDSFSLHPGKTLEESEADMFRQDIKSRPDSATMADYARIPVEAFGAALLRGMGQTNPGDAKTRPPPTEPIVPKSRPALLGLGAKALSTLPDGQDESKLSKIERERKEREKRRQDMHFVPLVKRLKSNLNGSSSDLLLPPTQNGDDSNAPSPAASSVKSERHRDLQDSDYDSSSRRPSRRTSPDPYAESARWRREGRAEDRRDGRQSERRQRSRSPAPGSDKERADSDHGRRTERSESWRSSRRYEDDDRYDSDRRKNRHRERSRDRDSSRDSRRYSERDRHRSRRD